MDGEARPYSPADARLTAILDSLLLGAVIVDEFEGWRLITMNQLRERYIFKIDHFLPTLRDKPLCLICR